MQKLKRLLIVIMLFGTEVQAVPDCSPIIQACDAAIAAQQKQISIRDLRVTQDESLIATLKNTNAQLEASSQAWYNSHTLWFFVGVFAAGGATYLLKR